MILHPYHNCTCTRPLSFSLPPVCVLNHCRNPCTKMPSFFGVSGPTNIRALSRPARGRKNRDTGTFNGIQKVLPTIPDDYDSSQVDGQPQDISTSGGYVVDNDVSGLLMRNDLTTMVRRQDRHDGIGWSPAESRGEGGSYTNHDHQSNHRLVLNVSRESSTTSVANNNYSYGRGNALTISRESSATSVTNNTHIRVDAFEDARNSSVSAMSQNYGRARALNVSRESSATSFTSNNNNHKNDGNVEDVPRNHLIDGGYILDVSQMSTVGSSSSSHHGHSGSHHRPTLSIGSSIGSGSSDSRGSRTPRGRTKVDWSHAQRHQRSRSSVCKVTCVS